MTTKTSLSLPNPIERPLLSVPEVAKILGLGRDATYEAIRRGDIPSLKLGERSIRVPTAKLRELLGISPVPITSNHPPKKRIKRIKRLKQAT